MQQLPFRAMPPSPGRGPEGQSNHRPPLPKGPVRAKWPLTPPQGSSAVKDLEALQGAACRRRSVSVDVAMGAKGRKGMREMQHLEVDNRSGHSPRRRAPSVSAVASCWDAPCWARPHPRLSASAVSVAEEANSCFRDHMEDGHKIIDPLPVHDNASAGRGFPEERWGYFAVYDGHGGREAVDFCEAHLHEHVASELRRLPRNPHHAPDRSAVFIALTAAFKHADGRLAEAGATKCGCTATVALTHTCAAGTTLYVANVGDSRGVFLGGQGIRQVTSDHRATQPAEHRRIQLEGGFVLHGRVCGSLMVSRSLGDHHLKDGGVSCVPDVCACKVNIGRALVMASDGLWDAMDGIGALQVVEDCIGRASAQAGSAEQAAQILRDTAASSLVESAKNRGSRDNILAMVIFF